MKHIVPLIVIVLLVGFDGVAAACPEALRTRTTKHLDGVSLCALHDRYHSALRQLEAKGLRPAARVGNVMAPRFIKLKDWLAKRDRTPNRAWTAYEPAPVTWANWDKAARLIDRSAANNYASGTWTPLDLEWLATVHGAAMSGLTSAPGQIRDGYEAGFSNERAFGLTAAQIRGIREVSFESVLHVGEGLTTFRPTACLEDQPESLRRAYSFSYGSRPAINWRDWPELDGTTFFTASDGQPKQCGFILYAEPGEVMTQLRKWLAYAKDASESWSLAKPSGPDPVLTISRIQRWFIAIHPYGSGNGRTSRFVMDWMFESLGLPAPILADMDNDLSMTEAEWATHVGQGLLRSVRAAESCVLRPNIPGCKVIPKYFNAISADASQR